MIEKGQKRTLFLSGDLQVREKQNDEQSRVIEGCAIVFNRETILWDGKYYREREMILPSCVTPGFLMEQDVKLNLLHSRNDTMCRNNRGVGTLHLEIREDGLYFSAEMPRCDIGERCLALIRNKTYTGCSFEFTTKDYVEEVTSLDDGREDYYVRHVQFSRLSALTIAMDPAYSDTSVDVRERFIRMEDEARAMKCGGEADKSLDRHKREITLLQLLSASDMVLEDRVY